MGAPRSNRAGEREKFRPNNGAAGGMRFTVHSIEQYISRVRPGLTIVQATHELRANQHDAVKVGKTAKGDDLYLVPALRCRLVVRYDRGLVVTTILEAEGTDEVEETGPPAPQETQADLQFKVVRRLLKYLELRGAKGDHEAARLAADVRNSGLGDSL